MVEAVRRSLVKFLWWLGSLFRSSTTRGWRDSPKKNNLDFM